MHTRDRKYVADGFDAPIRAYRAPYLAGTRLTVHDIHERYDEFTSVSGEYEKTPARIKLMLASNNLRASKGHAEVKLVVNDAVIKPMFRGRGRVIGADLEWGRNIGATVRAYRRRSGAGSTYVRLDGLYQFASSFDSEVPFDVTVDIATRLVPADEGYPLTASRNALSGPAARSLREVRQLLTTDYLSATTEKSTIEVYDEDDGSADIVKQNRGHMGKVLLEIFNDPDVLAGLELVKGGVEKLREQQNVIQQRRAARQRAERAQAVVQLVFSQEGETVRPPSAPRARAGISQQRVTKQKRRRKSNPFAGLAVFKVNKKQFKSAKLRKYFDRPERWTPLITIWRLTCQLVLQEASRRRVPAFEVGLILDDDIKAEYEVEGNKKILYLNPDWMMAEIRAFAGRPLAVAVVLHAKAVHEVTHLMGQGAHDEGFVALREALAEETASVLYPLTTMVESVLKVKPAPTPENKEVARLRRKVAQLQKRPVRARGSMAVRRLVQQEMRAARQRHR